MPLSAGQPGKNGQLEHWGWLGAVGLLVPVAGSCPPPCFLASREGRKAQYPRGCWAFVLLNALHVAPRLGTSREPRHLPPSTAKSLTCGNFQGVRFLPGETSSYKTAGQTLGPSPPGVGLEQGG